MIKKIGDTSLNNHYINIVEKTSGLAPNCNPENPNLDKSTVHDIINIKTIQV